MRALSIYLLALLINMGSFGFVHSAPSNLDEALIDGFNKTVFGSEYSGLLSQSYVHKFTKQVRFYVNSHVKDQSRKTAVESFIRTLPRLIHGLDARIVQRRQDANFVIHIVNRAGYALTIRKEVYNQKHAPIRGRCMVRSKFSRSGILRSDAVIVADEGNDLFQRCKTEEILQGLGPLNDHRSLSKSMFNDTSTFTSFRRFDRYILNMLYDRRVKNGMSKKNVQAILPKVLRRVRSRILGAK